MGNSSVGCFCCCCAQSADQHQTLLQQKSVYRYYGEKREAEILSLSEKSSGYHQLATQEAMVPEKQNNIIEFNDYDDTVNINNDLLLIFGFIRNAQNCLSPDISHHIIPQSVINIICNYYQISTLSIFKTKCNSIKDKTSMRLDVEQIACNVEKLFINGSSLFFLSTNDHIYVFGSNESGKLGVGSATESWSRTVNQPQTTTFYQKHKFKVVSSSSCYTHHSIAVTVNNDVYGYGSNRYCKRIGIQNPSNKNIYNPRNKEELFWPTLIDIKYIIIDIQMGDGHSLFLTDNGKVLGCGSNFCRQIGIAHYKVEGIELIHSLLDHTIIQIRCGRIFSLVLTDNGILKGFGNNEKCQLGTGNKEPIFRDWSDDIQIIDIKVNKYINPKIKTMECGWAHVCCLDVNGNIYCWGNNEKGQCGKYSAALIATPIQVGLGSVTHIACGSNYTVAMDYEMNIYAWGGCHNYVNQRNEKSTIHVAKYSEFQHRIDGKQIIDIKAGQFKDIYLCVANH